MLARAVDAARVNTWVLAAGLLTWKAVLTMPEIQLVVSAVFLFFSNLC